MFPVPSTEPLPSGYHSYAIVHGEESMDLTEYVLTTTSYFSVFSSFVQSSMNVFLWFVWFYGLWFVRRRNKASQALTHTRVFLPLLMNVNLMSSSLRRRYILFNHWQITPTHLVQFGTATNLTLIGLFVWGLVVYMHSHLSTDTLLCSHVIPVSCVLLLSCFSPH